MKRSNAWFALIVIMSALLLSAAEKDSPSPEPTPQPSKTADLGQKQTEQHPTPLPRLNLSNAPEQRTTDKEASSSDAATTVIMVSAVVSAVAALLIALFNWQLVGVTDEMKKATAEAAKAAKDSARTADLALNIEKPYLFLEPLRIEETTQTVPDFVGVFLPEPHKQLTKTIRTRWLSVRVANKGKGIAIVEEIYLRPCIASRESQKIGRGERLAIPERVIGADKFSPTGTYIADKLAPPVVDMMLTRFAVVGYVRYRDVYDRRYKSTFGYYYRPGNILIPQSSTFFLAAEKHNRIYEEKQNGDLSNPK